MSNAGSILAQRKYVIPFDHNLSQSIELFNLDFQPLEVVSRYRDFKCLDFFVKFKSEHIYQCFKIEGIFYF